MRWKIYLAVAFLVAVGLLVLAFSSALHTPTATLNQHFTRVPVTTRACKWRK